MSFYPPQNELTVYATAVNDGNNIGSAVTPKAWGTFRIAVQFTTSAKLVVIMNDGSTAKTIAFNSNVALTSAAGYTFTWPANPDYSYTFQPSGANVTVDILQVDFVRAEQI